jgi:hypothetical protein
MVKYIEDRWNVEEDVRLAGVSVIILIEDSVRYYSSFLPHLYAEVVKQLQSVIAEGVNLTHRLMRMRARPKILLAGSYEEAEAYYRRYREVVLGIISDVDFPRDGENDPLAGIDFARIVRADNPDLPILLQTTDPEYAQRAQEVGASAVLKDSPLLLDEVRRFMLDNFGFGAFIFRRGDGAEVARAVNLGDLERVLPTVPDEALYDHASRHHFSTWLRARTEFRLAAELRRKQVSDFPSVAALRAFILESIREFRRERQSGVVAAFDPEAFDPEVGFAQIGGGSMGGKARGLAFIRALLYNHRVRHTIPGVRIQVPASVVLATDVFDHFLEENRLRDFVMNEEDEAAIEAAFLKARFPRRVLSALHAFLNVARYPLAVRSSSLLEDSPYQPFAGIYRTIMIPNNDPDRRVRQREVVRAIKRVYASVFTARAKAYFKATTLRLEEEKMAVLLQRVGGAAHGPRFYPEISGVARSRDFYPVPPLRAEDGVASAALGLGKTVVEGEKALRFSPTHPDRVVDFQASREGLENAQSGFYALMLDAGGEALPEDEPVLRFGLETARDDGTLAAVASVYSPENDAVYDGLSRPGVPFVSLAPVLKHGVFPLAPALRLLLELGERGMNAPVELEFAVNLSVPPGERQEFFLVQMRPMTVVRDLDELPVGPISIDEALVSSGRILGNGRIDGIRDLVVVDRARYAPGHNPQIARELARMNGRLAGRAPYVLIGPGRLGSSEPWLGVPVAWDEIAGARVIVEVDLQGKSVAPSQGSHFFHNLTASLSAYLTVPSEGDGFVDWEWLSACPSVEEGEYVRRLRLERPVTVILDGRRGRGVILKPDAQLSNGG